MPRELLILRHGEAGSAQEDFHRPLSERGRSDARRVGARLAENDVLPDATVSSQAERARATAEAALEGAGLDVRNLLSDRRIYGGGRAQLMDVLAVAATGPGRLMLVGHNPGLEILLRALAGPNLPYGPLMKPATLARLGMPDDWRALEAGSATLIEVVAPEMLTSSSETR